MTIIQRFARLYARIRFSAIANSRARCTAEVYRCFDQLHGKETSGLDSSSVVAVEKNRQSARRTWDSVRPFLHAPRL